ncbi:YdbH domain-containing protein [Reichenbachiella agarivorans]|uniref:YdbH domain-containing protein n=1 Tax=Reichenbachiella agarivorans TaxID=2979464 RepID=A0ABY6CSP8_9BACT|nr:YdbH domain-containing protein [Reichenbachiella agarivorans]UXP33513.1 YdbH domain-containing protein [Reichenbachiella agarivorans]
MKRPVRILSIIFFIIVIFTVLLEVLAKIVFHDRISHEIERIIDETLESELTFSDVNISTIRNFPTATIIIDSVLIREQGYDILRADKILLRMNPFDLLKDDFIFNTVEIIGAKFQAPVDSTGQKFMIKGKAKPDKASRTLHVHVPNILIRDAEISIYNDFKKNRIKISVSRGVFKMISSNDLISFEGNAKAVLDTMINKGSLVATDVKIAAQDASFRFGQVDQRNLFDGILKIEDAHVKVTGVLKPTGNGNIMDITLEGDESDLNNYLTILPQLKQVKLVQINPDARLSFKMKVAGYVNPINYPFIDVSFDLSNAAFEREGSRYKVHNVNLKGSYSNGSDKSPESSSLVIESGTARIDSSFVVLHGSYTNFADPYIDLDLESNLDLTELDELLDLPYFEHLKGKVKVKLALEGKLSDHAKLGQIENRRFNGRIEFMGVTGTLDSLGIKLSNLNGWIDIKNENIQFSKISGNLNQSLFTFSGSVLNFVPLIDSSSSKRTVAELKIDLQEFSIPKSTKKNGTQTSHDYTFDYSFFPKKLDLVLNFKSHKIGIGDIHIEKVKMGAHLNRDSVLLKSIEFYFENGKIMAEGKSRFKEGKGVENVLDLDIDFKYMNVNDLINKLTKNSTSKNRMSMPDNLIVHTKIKVDQLDFDHNTFTNVDVLGRYAYDTIQLKRANLDFALGQIKSHAQIVAINTLPDIVGDVAVTLVDCEIDSLKAFYRSFIMHSDSSRSKGRKKEKASPYFLRDINLHVNSPSISHHQLKLEDFDARLVLNDKNLDLTEASFKIFDGQLNLSALIERNDSLNVNTIVYLTARNVSAGDVADALPEENQKLLNSKNLQGSVNIDGMLLLTYDQNLIHQDKDFLGKIKIEFNEGKLIQFKPVTEPLKFLNDKVTDTIYVTNKDFSILFHNDEVIVPKTIFSSNITDIEFLGYHNKEISFGFDLKVSISDFLFKSQKKKRAAVDDKKATVRGINYYLSARTVNDEMEIKSLKRKEYDWQYKLLHERYRQVNFMMDQRLDSAGHSSSVNTAP